MLRDRESSKFINAEKIEGLIKENFAITKGRNIEEGVNSRERKIDRDKKI